MKSEQFTQNLKTQIERLRRVFDKGDTRPIEWRMEKLKALKAFLSEKEDEINQALWIDLRKSAFESAVTEQGLVMSEIDFALDHLAEWLKVEKVSTPLINQPGHCEIRREPYGLVLIIGAWNYPINLTLAPLVGAIAGGNVCLVKPSEIATETSALLAKHLPEYLGPDFIAVIEGGVDETQTVLDQDLDFIFFTGSSKVGKIVMARACEHLTPVVLELGGKSPAIVLDDASLEVAARRIAWGKFMNAGQTCIAPDYVLVSADLKDRLIAEIHKSVKIFYGDDAEQSPDYCRIVNSRNFDRLMSFMGDGVVEFGGTGKSSERYIAPTLLSRVSPESTIMQEEIFGPILPILTIADADEAICFVKKRPKPLALYLFTQSQSAIEKVVTETSSGGVCINDVVMHMPVAGLPFGGVGASGMGNYHGRRSFETFTHSKGILSKGTWPDFSIRYPPYNDDHIKWLNIVR
ncbi:MAG: aldehyde dehydrogenase family protein [Proteobacteria bacterium]|nr:MAG: aldehyde dehydrogenase family protein [Pseudomonadota bacterium]